MSEPTGIDYRAHGVLIHAYRLQERIESGRDLYLILTKWQDEYVVAHYLAGSPEWSAGRYFDGDQFGEADACFLRYLADRAQRAR